MKEFPLLPPRTNILFVGDNVGPLKAISFELQRARCSILWETRGIDAIRTVGLERPDLIICESELPDISGLDVCRRIRTDSRSRDLPFVIVGDAKVSGADLDALEAGADEFFTMPGESERLLSKVFWLVEDGHSKLGSTGYYKNLRSQRTYISMIMKETSDLLHDLDRKNMQIGLGRRRVSEVEPGLHDRIDLGMHLIGVAADLFEEEALELDLTESFASLAC